MVLRYSVETHIKALWKGSLVNRISAHRILNQKSIADRLLTPVLFRERDVHMYTQKQIILLAAAQLMTQVREANRNAGMPYAQFSKTEAQQLETAMQAWLDENGIELSLHDYGYYRVTQEQFDAAESKELTPLPFILFDK